ncbi:MAG: mandelate racemase/muconate lactonizing enzyme family protein, partial [Sphingomonadales bacterium]|nr:mandelate racemase/muconate lactonizing enzyme family protein [Sphingomonadales bacterium]
MGAHGWGEVWANFPPSGAESKARLLETLIVPTALGRTYASPTAAWIDLTNRMRRNAIQSAEPGPFAACLAGIDVALWDLVARRAGVGDEIGLAHRGAEPVPQRVPVR